MFCWTDHENAFVYFVSRILFKYQSEIIESESTNENDRYKYTLAMEMDLFS